VEFHKSKLLTWVSLAMVVVGAVGSVLFVGWLLGEGGRRTSIMLIVCPFILLIGLLGVVTTMVPLKLRIDEYGIRVRNRRERVDLPGRVPWQAFEAITLGHKPDELDKDPYVIAWPKGPIPGLPQDKAIRRGHAVGYALVSVGDLTESAAQVAAGFRRYAGPLFRDERMAHNQNEE
jgi:hypothetical protein